MKATIDVYNAIYYTKCRYQGKTHTVAAAAQSGLGSNFEGCSAGPPRTRIWTSETLSGAITQYFYTRTAGISLLF